MEPWVCGYLGYGTGHPSILDVSRGGCRAIGLWTMSDEIRVQRGFPDEYRPKAAELYDAAFGAKLSAAMPDPVSRKAVLEEGLNPRFSLAALSGGEMVGIAGFRTESGSLTGGISYGLLRARLGFLGAIRAVPLLVLLERKQTPGELLMDGIGVSPRMRGRGIGTRLLRGLLEYAAEEGYLSVRLDVIDTNRGARRLYERVGFVPVRVQRFGYLKRLLGFGAATRMEYRLGSRARPGAAPAPGGPVPAVEGSKE